MTNMADTTRKGDAVSTENDVRFNDKSQLFESQRHRPMVANGYPLQVGVVIEFFDLKFNENAYG